MSDLAKMATVLKRVSKGLEGLSATDRRFVLNYLLNAENERESGELKAAFARLPKPGETAAQPQ